MVYVNGIEVPEWRENMNPGATSYDLYSAGVVGSPEQNTYLSRLANAGPLLRIGANTVAVELHQGNPNSSDLYFDLALTIPGEKANVFAQITVTNDVTVKARAFDGAEWSALSENVLTIRRPPMDYAALRVSELMYAPPEPEPGSPYNQDNFAWLELCNTGINPLDLEGVSFDGGITHTFAPFMLAPGGRLVLVNNVDAFATRHPTNDINVLPWSGGKLARGGETLSLIAPGASNILAFTYSKAWHPQTFNTGSSLVAIDLAASEPLWSTSANWRPSYVGYGTPGLPEPVAFTNARVTSGGFLLVDGLGLGAAIELWFSEDLNHWAPCDAAAWSRTNATLSIDLKHPSLLASPQCFFQIRVAD